MKKINKYILFFIVFLAAIVFLLLINSSAYKKAQNSCKLFSEFQNYIISNNWEEAEKMLYSSEGNNEQSNSDSVYHYIENRPVIENGKLISLGGDVTDEIAKAKPKYFATYDYYRSKKSHDDKIILTNGYMLFKNGKIIFIKIP